MDHTNKKVADYRAHMKATILRLRQDLDAWIAHYSGPPRSLHPEESEFSTDDYTEISAALLQTAIDRYIKLHGPTDAFSFIKRAFDREAETYRRSLQ